MNLKTDRLLLTEIKREDASDIYEYRSDVITNKYQGWVPASLNEVFAFIEKVSPFINVPGTWFQLAIRLNESDKLIGDLGIHFLENENSIVEIGCTLNIRYQKQGYATEALSRVITYLFTELNKQRIITSIDPRNSNSVELVERLGFVKESSSKESLLNNDEWVDDVVYILLRMK